MKVKSLRKVRIASLSGHICIIPADTVTEIPAILAEEAYALGCVPVADDGSLLLDSEGNIAATAAATPAEDIVDVAALNKVGEDGDEIDESDFDGELPEEPADMEPEVNPLFAVFDQLADEGDEAKFNKNTGAPKVGAVRDLFDGTITAEEVDVAWSQYAKG